MTSTADRGSLRSHRQIVPVSKSSYSIAEVGQCPTDENSVRSHAQSLWDMEDDVAVVNQVARSL